MDVPKGQPLAADPKAFLEVLHSRIYNKLEEEIWALNGIKFQLALKVQLRKTGTDGTEEYTDKVFHHKQEAIIQPSEIDGALDKTIPHILELYEKWTQRGSGWVIDQVKSLWLDIARYKPWRGGSYNPLPREVQTKKVVINVKNKDDHCLRWALRSALNPATHHVESPSQYPTLHNLSFKVIDAPTSISQIPKVEKQNNLAINVFGWKKLVIIHHLSKQPANMPRINLQLIGNAGKFHYIWIKDLNRLLYDQKKHRQRKHFYERCLHGYNREDLLESHRLECRGISQTAVRVYADFEALTTKTEGPELNPMKSNTRKTHEACSYCYIVVRCDGQTELPVEYRGPNAAEHFLEALQEEERKIKTVLANPNAMRMTRED